MYPSPSYKPTKACLTSLRSALRQIVVTLLLSVCFIFPVAWAAPIATNTALPISAGAIIIREQIVTTHASDVFGGLDRHVDLFAARTVLGYGLTSKLALFGMLPLINIDRTLGDVSTSHSGLGDAALFARFEVIRLDKPGQTLRIAPFGGLRFPTGREGKTGDGSLDIFGGLIATLASTQWSLDSQLRYDLNREANGFERGDSTRFESSFQYRLTPGKVIQDTAAFFYGVLEFSASYYERNRVNGITDPDSGGFQLFLTPGLQYATRRWVADLGIKFPIVNDLNGTALETDYSILTSIRVNF